MPNYHRVLFMKVAIIGAMEEEISLIRSHINNLQILQYVSHKIYTGHIEDIDVALLKSGIGKVSSAIGTALLIQYCKPDVVINTGSAGSLSSSLNIGDVVISKEVRYHDVDITAFGYNLGQMAGCPTAFLSDRKLIVLAESSIRKLQLNSVCGLICSGDAFINGSKSLARIRSDFPNTLAVEMEAAAIGHVCHLFSIPFVAIRTISDVADDLSHTSFKEFLLVTSEQSAMILNTMIKSISKLF